MANNLLVDWLNNKKKNVQTNVLKKAATNTNNVTTPNLPIKPTTVSQTGLNLQKAQQPTQTKLNNINTQTLPTQTNTGVGSIAQNPNQSRFIGFQQQQPQAKSFNKLMNNGYLYVPTAESQANFANAKEENRYRTMSEAFYDLQGTLYNRKKTLSESEMRQKFPEFKDLDIDVLNELQNELLPIVRDGKGVDADQISQIYPELLKGKELKDIQKIKESVDINNKKLQQIQTNIDKTLKTNWQSLSPNGMKYIQNWNTVLKTLDEAKKQGVVGGASNVEIIDYLAKNNPEFNNIFKELNGLELSEMDKAIVGKKDASLLKQVQNKMSQILIDQVTNSEKPTDEEIESVMRGKEKLENDFWGQTGKKIATEIGVPVDSLEKLTYRTYKDIQNKILETGMEYTKDYAKKELKSAFKEGLGVDLTDEQLNSIDNLYNKAAAPSINEQIKINKQNVIDYAESVNKEYESRKARNLDPDVENYVNNMGMTRSLLQGNLAAFGYKSAGDMAQNADMLVTTALGVVAPEVVLPLMAVDSYSRESQESFEELMETQKKMGISQDEAYDNAQKGSVIVGLASATVELALEKLIGGVETTASKAWHDAFTKEFTKKATEMMTERGLADILKQGATTQFKASLEEGLEEVLQQAIHNKSVQQYDPDQKLTEGLLQAFEGGFYNPMNLLAGGGDVFSNIDTNSIKQGVNNTVDNATARARNIINNVKDVTSRIEPAPGKIGEVFDSMRNKVTSQGGTNNTQQQGQQTQFNTTSENQNNINGDNYSQKNKNNKTLNKVQLGMLQNDNRMNPTKITEFKEKFGKDYGQALADMGYTESQETNVPKIEEDTKEIYNEKKKAMNSVQGEFQDRSLADMLEIMLQKAKNTKDYEMIDKYEKLTEKHNTKGLTMAEANDMREEFSYKIKTRWNTENNSDKIDLANNVYTAVRKFLEDTAEANGISDLQEMNREIAMRKYLSTWIGDKAERQSANNMVSLTDWIMLAEAASNPYAAAGLAVKKIVQTPTVKNAVLNAVVGRRENRAIDKQNRQAENKKRMENIESANEGKRLQEELSIPETPALPNGIKLTKVTEINNPKNKVTSKKKNTKKSESSKKSDSSSSDDTTPPSGGTPTGGTPAGTNPTNNQGGTPTTDDTKNAVTKKQPKKKAEVKKDDGNADIKGKIKDATGDTYKDEYEELSKGKKLYRGETYGNNSQVFWTDDKDIADSFGDTTISEKSIIMNNPLDVRLPAVKKLLQEEIPGINIDSATSAYKPNIEEKKKLMNWAKENGYDGIIGETSDLGQNYVGNEYIVLNDNQVNAKPKNKITSKKAEDTAPKQEENQTSEHFSYKDYGEFMEKYEAAEKEINDRLDKQMDKERAEKMERFNELTKKEDKTDAEGNEMMKLAGELNNMSNKYDRLKEEEFNKKYPELVAEKQRQNEMFDRDWKAAMDKKFAEIEKPFNNLRDKYLKELRDELGIADGVTLDSDFYNSLTPEQKKIADEINKEYAEKYEELRQKMASIKKIEEESKTKITGNKKNKVTNPSKVKESGLFNENEVDKGNKSEGLNPDALPLSDYREMQRLTAGGYTSLGNALDNESLGKYIATKVANEKVGIKPDRDDNEAWDNLPEDFEYDWNAVSDGIEEMYGNYQDYLEMKEDINVDEKTLKDTLDEANRFADIEFPGKTAKEVIEQYTPEYESDLEIYNRLNEKYPGVFSNGKIDLTGTEGRARREFANQENETAQDIDYQELAEMENQTPQDIDYQDLAELENETPQMVDIDEGVDATTQLIDEFNNLKPGEFKWIGDNREAGVRKTFLDANIKIPGEGDSVDIYFQPGESGDKMYINLHDTSNTGIRNTNEVLNKLDIPYRIGSEFDEKLNETRYYLENKLTHSKAYFDKNGASWLSVNKTLRGKEIVPRRNAEEQAEYNMQMEQRRAEIEAEREQDRIKAEERKAEEERQQEIDKQMKANLLRYVDIKHNDNPLGRGRTLKDLSEKNSEASNKIRYYGDDVADDAGVWQVLDVLANKNGKIKEVRESDSKSSYSYEYYDEELGRNNNISGLNKTQRDYLEYRIKASQTEKRVNNHLDKIENKSLKTRVENKLNEMKKRQDDNGKTQYGTDAQYIDYLVLDKGFTPKEFPTGKTYANGEPKIDYMIVNEKNVGYISSKIENDYARSILETPEEELSAEDEAKLDELFTPKTTTEVTGEKNAVTAKEAESEKPKNLVTSRIENTKQEIQEIDKDTYFDDIVKNLKDHPREMFIYKDGNYFYPHYILPSGKVITPENTFWGEVSSEEAARNWLLKEAEEHSEANETKKAEKLKEIVGKTAEKYEATLKRIESDNPMQEIWTSGDYFKYGMGNNQMARAKKESEANAEVGTFKKDVIDGKEGYRIFVAGTKNEAIRAFYEPKTGKTYRIYRGPIIDDSKPYTTKQVERIEKFLQNVDKQLDKETKKEKKEEKQVITQEWLDSLKPDKDGVIELDSKGNESFALRKGKETLIKEGKADGKYIENYGGERSPQYLAFYIKDGVVYEGRKGLEDQYMKTKQEAVDWVNQKEKDVEHESTERYTQTDYETLPKTISVETEAEKAGPKRIAPDRVKRQQETYDQGLESVKNVLKQSPVKIYELGFKSDRSKAVQNILEERKRIRQLPETEAEKQWNELAKSVYEDLVIKDISKGYRYPEDVTSKFPKAQMKKAVDARARYEKGLFTSFSAKDTRANNQYRDEIGAGIKSQDGKPVTQEQMNEIVDGIRSFGSVFGLNMKKFAEDNNIIYVHLHGGNPFLMGGGGKSRGGGMNIAGLYRKGADGNISISLGGVELVMEKGEDGEMKKNNVNATPEHELAHAVDYMLENKLFSSQDIEILKKTMNKPTRLINYYNRSQEIVARAVEQYAANKTGKSRYGKPYVSSQAYWDQENFDKYVKPIVEKNMKEKMKDYLIQQPKNNVIANDKNKITSK